MVKLNKRSKQIFEILRNHPKGITGEYISQQLGVSTRTIRSDMKILQNALSEYEVEIVSSPRGYRFQEFSQLNEVEQKLFQNNNNTNLETSEERVHYILCRLLENTFLDKAITQNNLADEMFVSLSTLKSHLNKVKLILAKYDLKIVQDGTKGIKITGQEQKIRYCLSEVVNMKRENIFFQKILPEVSIVLLNKIIKEVLSARNLQLTDNAKENLSVHTAIAIERAKYSKEISYPASLAKQIENTFEYSVAKEIVAQIYEQAHIDLSYGEVYYIAQCLLASKKVFDVGQSSDQSHAKDLVKAILAEIHDRLSIDFTNDECLINGLTLHLNIALNRIKFQMHIDNELLETIKSDYPLAFQMGVIAGKVVEDKDNIIINENEIGYIALHFGAALSRNNIKEKVEVKNVIIVCSSGLGMSVLLKAKIEEYFHNRLNIVKILPGYEVTKKLIDNVDYILTTVPLKNIKSDKIIEINRILRKSDIDKIESKIFKKPLISIREILRFFDKNNFYINENFKTKSECINFLTDEAIKKGLMSEIAKQSVFEREKIASTSIGDLTAIPHPIYNEQGKSFISILVLDKPILWDDLLVQVVFLLNVENSKSALWEKVFLTLYDYIKLNNGINSILINKSFKIFIREYLYLLKGINLYK